MMPGHRAIFSFSNRLIAPQLFVERFFGEFHRSCTVLLLGYIPLKQAVAGSVETQYAALGVELEFDDQALEAIAQLAISRNTGARGLRSIMENLMTDLMYEIPSRDDVASVRVTANCVLGTENPQIILKASSEE